MRIPADYCEPWVCEDLSDRKSFCGVDLKDIRKQIPRFCMQVVSIRVEPRSLKNKFESRVINE